MVLFGVKVCVHYTNFRTNSGVLPRISTGCYYVVPSVVNIDKGLDRSWGFGQNFEVEKLRISGTDLRGPNIAVILETSRLDIGQKMAGLAWFCTSTNFLARKAPSSRPL